MDNKEIHVFFYNPFMNTDNDDLEAIFCIDHYTTKKRIECGDNFIYTTQPQFISQKYMDMGYDIYIHSNQEDDEIKVDISMISSLDKNILTIDIDEEEDKNEHL